MLFIAIVILVSMAGIAQAYLLSGYRLEGKTVTYKWGSNLQTPGTIIRNGYVSAMPDWNSTAGFSFTENAYSDNILQSFYVPSDSYYGYAEKTEWSGNIITAFTTYVNSGNIYITQTNVARSVAGHEFGHPFGIDDLSSGDALMNQYRNRSSIYNPQTDDINGITAIYG